MEQNKGKAPPQPTRRRRIVGDGDEAEDTGLSDESTKLHARRDSPSKKALRVTIAKMEEDMPVKKSAGWCSKSTYFLMFSVSLSCWFVEVSNVFHEYKQFPIGTQWNTVYEDKFEYPDLLFCPSIWLNETKAQVDYKLSNSTILFIYGYLMGTEVTLMRRSYMAKISRDKAQIKEEIGGLVSTLNLTAPVLPKLMRALAYDIKDIINYPEGILDKMLEDNDIREAVVDTNYGVCYYRRIPHYPKESLPATNLLQMYVKFPKRESPIVIGTPLVRTIFGYEMGNKLPVGGFIMSRNMIYQARTERVHAIQIKTAGNRCHEGQRDGFMSSCHHACYNQVLFIPCMGCSKPAGLNASLEDICNDFELGDRIRSNPNSSKCTNPTKQDMRRMNEDMKACMEQCPHEACDHWKIETVVESTPLEGQDSYKSELRLIQGFQYAHLEMKEVWTYTWHTFISNIGGQMGLWLGMSLFSILQLIETFFGNFWAYWRPEKRKEKGSKNDPQKLVHPKIYDATCCDDKCMETYDKRRLEKGTPVEQNGIRWAEDEDSISSRHTSTPIHGQHEPIPVVDDQDQIRLVSYV